MSQETMVFIGCIIGGILLCIYCSFERWCEYQEKKLEAETELEKLKRRERKEPR